MIDQLVGNMLYRKDCWQHTLEIFGTAGISSMVSPVVQGSMNVEVNL